MFRSSDTYVVQSRSWLPDWIGGVTWFGAHAAHGTVYNPVVIAMSSTPDCLAYGWQGVFNTSTSFWAHRNVINFAQVKFDYMISDIKAKQKELEDKGLSVVNQISEKFKSASRLSLRDIEYITEAFVANAEFNRQAYVELLNFLMFRYADGFINSWNNNIFSAASVGYPAWWLEAVGYPDGPPPVTSN